VVLAGRINGGHKNTDDFSKIDRDNLEIRVMVEPFPWAARSLWNRSPTGTGVEALSLPDIVNKCPFGNTGCAQGSFQIG
jgi:hypothetical protein